MIELSIPGKPMAKGSKRLVTLKTGRPMLLDSNKRAADWQAHVTDIAAEQHLADPLAGPVRVEVEFCFARPQCHYRTGKHADELKPSAPRYHTQKPDADKLMRTLGDGLTNGGIWRDDSQAAVVQIVKRWTPKDYTFVRITEIKPEDYPT